MLQVRQNPQSHAQLRSRVPYLKRPSSLTTVTSSLTHCSRPFSMNSCIYGLN
jgi:hypothetical protein